MADRSRILFWSLVLVAIAIGIVHAYSLRYVNDDCFVSFRYAKNLVDGRGLVYNAEERVEGYTNFLWTMLIAGGMKLGFDPVPFSMVAGVCFFVLSLLACAVLSLKLQGRSPAALAGIPLTAIALSLHRDYAAHATSGMETSMYAFFVLAAFVLLSLKHSRATLSGAGVALTLAMMTRPDGVVFLAAALAYLLLVSPGRVRACFFLLAPVVVLFVPYWFWRYQYFGYFFPNAFYAKSVALPYYAQGLEYIRLYWKTYYVAALLPILAIVALAGSRPRFAEIVRVKSFLARFGATDDTSRPEILALFFTVAYLAFIVRLGGDFMFARFLIPVTPMAWFLLESLAGRVAPGRLGYVLGAVVIAGTFFRYDQYRDNSFVGYVADEARYFTVDQPLERSQHDGKTLAGCFDGLPVRVAVWAGQLRLAYYADPPYVIESSGGITDAAVAHQQITGRGRPGHEKIPSLEYLVRRKVHFYLGPTDPPAPGQFVLNIIRFDSIRARIITYDDTIMRELAKRPGVSFVPFPEYLDTYIPEMKNFTPERIARDYEYFRTYYFEHNDDPLRQSAFLPGAGHGSDAPPGIDPDVR